MSNATATHKASSIALSDDDIAKIAPAVFSDKPHSAVSERYQLFSTIDIVRGLREHNWKPVAVTQTRSKDEQRMTTNRHMIRFRHGDSMGKSAKVGEYVPEVVLINAHNRNTAYQLHAGIFRFVCSNGLVVSDAEFATRKYRHTPKVLEQMIEGTYEIAAEVPKIAEQIDAWRSKKITKAAAKAFAKEAAEAMFKNVTFDIDALLVPRRPEDTVDTVWGALNVIQENVMRGGIEGQSESGRKTKTRGMNRIGAQVRLNKDLWALARDHYAKVA